jgi:condensin complex subunit 3
LTDHQRRPLRDAVSKNALIKFEATLGKKFAAQLEGFSEEEYRKLEELQDLFKFLDDMIPEDDEPEPETKKRGKKR